MFNNSISVSTFLFKKFFHSVLLLFILFKTKNFYLTLLNRSILESLEHCFSYKEAISCQEKFKEEINIIRSEKLKTKS